VFVFESFGGGQDLLGLDARAAWQFVPRLSLTLRGGFRQGLPEKSAHGSIHTSTFLGGLGLRFELAHSGRTHFDLFGRADAVDLHAKAYASPGARAHEAHGLALVTLSGLDMRSRLSRVLSATLEAGAGGVPRPVHLSDAGQRVSGVSTWAFALGVGTGTLATLLAWVLGAGHDPRVGLVLLALTVGAVGAMSTPWGALAAVLPVWALDTGFVLNRFGQLTLDHRGIPTLVVLTLAATVPSVATAWARQR